MDDTLIDSLVVRLGLDGRGYETGRKKVTEDFKRVRTEAATTTRDVEAYGKRAANYFGSLRNEVVGLFLAFAGARGVVGFVGNIISSDAAVGRLAKNLGVATRELSAWQGLAKSQGGAAGDADAAFRLLVGENQQRMLTGIAPHAADFQGLGLLPEDLANPTEALLKMAAAGERMTRPEFVARLQRIGIPESVITSLANGRRGTEALLREQYRLGTATDESSAAAQRMEARLSELQTAIAGKARPWIVWLLENMLTLSNNTDLAATALPILGIAAAGLAAPFLIAYGPVMALGAAIAYVLYESGRLQRIIPEMQSSLNVFTQRLALAKAEWDAIKRGDFDGFRRLLNEDLNGTFGVGRQNRFETQDPEVRAMLDQMYGRSGGASGGRGVDAIFERLIRQESGGRAGVTGPMTAYGQAHGLTQMLDGTARNMARKLGVEWRPDLMRGATPEAAAYQRRLGRAYFDEGLQRYGGDVNKALMYYHGGPNERLWGSKTRAYARAVGGGGSGGSSVTIGNINLPGVQDAQGFARDLPGAIGRRGLTANANSGLSG